MLGAARLGAESIGYRNAGTVEFLVHDGAFYFMEVNARIQVEHTITEMVTGVDLVAAQIRLAAKESTGISPGSVAATGHAVELRVCAEDPTTFYPGPGRITAWREPTGPGLRVDSGYECGDDVTLHYDSLLAKVCAWGSNRETALVRAAAAVGRFHIAGPKNNLPFLASLLADEEICSGDYDTTLVNRLKGRA